VLALGGGVCARAPVLILVLDPWLVMGRRHDGYGVSFPLGEVRCGRSVFAGRPRGRGGSSLRGAGRGASAEVGRWRTRASSCGLERLVAEVPERVVAAFEESAGDRQARALVSEPGLGLEIVVVVGRADSARDHGGLVERPAQRGGTLPTEVPGRAALIGLIDGDVQAGVADGVARGGEPSAVAEL
jgi:hypothetical protein